MLRRKQAATIEDISSGTLGEVFATFSVSPFSAHTCRDRTPLYGHPFLSSHTSRDIHHGTAGSKKDL